MSNDGKWACTVCSYANWPLARKCILCLTPKEAIVEGYKYKPEVIQPPSPKWTCKKCTFDNWPVSLKCTMCQTAKDDANFGEQISCFEGACTAAGARQSRRSRKHKSASQDVVTKDKWVCVRCTYVNYNKSKKCVMCQMPPGPGYCRQLSNSSTSSNETNEPRRGNRNIEKCKRPDRRAERRKYYYDSDSKKQIRNVVLQEDWPWINACIGAIEGDVVAVENYLIPGDGIHRCLTAEECRILSVDGVTLDAGQTLGHLAIRFSNPNIAVLLCSFQQQASRSSSTTNTASAGAALKRMPSFECPKTANEVRRIVASHLSQNTRGDFPCYYMCDPVTFVLPQDIRQFSASLQKRIFDDILDADAQRVLEVERCINWSNELVESYQSKLYALWNRSAGDCLLDSSLQSTWGVNDRDGSLRKALSISLSLATDKFYPRWIEYERMYAAHMHYTLSDRQLNGTWQKLIKIAEQPGKSLEQTHIFCLAHILRRPIIVYGVKYVHNYTGEALDLARFEGIYLPLLWDADFCVKSPIVLGYTRGHFSALVGIQRLNEGLYMPLVDDQSRTLHVHFITEEEVGLQDELIREWLETTVTPKGTLCAIQRVSSCNIMSHHLVEEWLLKYRKTTTT